MWQTIITIVLQLISWYLDKKKVSKEVKEAFYEFVKKAGNDFGSTKLMQWGDYQLKFLKETPFEESRA